MVNRVYRLPSTKEGFAKECNKLRTMFSKLRYPKTLVDSTRNKFSQEPDKETHTVPSVDPSVYIVLHRISDQLIAYAKISILWEPRSMLT